MATTSPPVNRARGQDTPPAQVLAIVCSGVILASLDLFIVNVALPKIGQGLGHPDLSDLSWVLNGYAIVFAALLVLAGRLADRHRRKYGFLLGVAIFTVASGACGVATNVGMLVAFRIVQAAGAALLTPTSLSLVLASYAPDRRNAAVRTWTAVGGFAAALGPVIGGLLVAVSWRWVFLVNVPIGIIALAIGWWKLPDAPGSPVERPDAGGAALVTIGVGALTFGLVKGGDWGWGSARTLVVLAIAVALLGVFLAHCLHHHNPLIDPVLFRVRSFSAATFVAFFLSAAFGGMLLSIVLWEQNVWHWSALQTGLAIAPGPSMVPVFSFLVAGRAIARFGPGPVIGTGSLVFAAGVSWWAVAVGLHPDYPADILFGMLLTGIGVGLAFPTLMAAAASVLPTHMFATGSATVNMVRQVGAAVGVAVLIAVLGTPSTAHGRLSAFRHGWIVTAALALLGAGASVLLRGPKAVPPALSHPG